REAFEKALGEAKPLSQFLVSELASRTDMASAEGRARFVAEAKPLLAQIVAPALGTLLRRQVAERAGLDPA
ncbi:MAG TPA: DNA primase, partial [Usitatibacteraceae bacterium]|nr:DNA primase [Usitatibacteraceae bacterium]